MKIKKSKSLLCINSALIVACLLLVDSKIFAQQKFSDSLINNILFKGNHLSIHLSRLQTKKAQLKQTIGNYPVSSSSAPGINLGIFYHINFNMQYSLVTGAVANVTGRNFIINFFKNDFSPPLNQDYFFKGNHTRAYDLFLSIPVTLERRFWYNNKNFISANLGVQVNYSTGADFDISDVFVEDVSNNFIKAAEINTDANNNIKPWLSFIASAGHNWRLKNNNYFQAGLQANLSFSEYVDGTYSVYVPGKQTSGIYTSTGTYYAVYIGYTFTNGNYRLRKTYENKRIE